MGCFMKKILLAVSILLLIAGLHPININAITIVSTKDVQESKPAMKVTQSNTVYLLNWQDNKLLTTKGTFLTNGIQIVNESGIEKDKISLQKKPLLIKFIKEKNKIIKIIIEPNP